MTLPFHEIIVFLSFGGVWPPPLSQTYVAAGGQQKKNFGSEKDAVKMYTLETIGGDNDDYYWMMRKGKMPVSYGGIAKQ